MKILAAMLAAVAPAVAAADAASLSRELRQLGIDPQECYRVRDLQLSKDEGRFFLNEGLIAFFKPVAGRRLGAIFSAEVEAGDAELLLIPPTRGERLSLATFTKSPNLEERFRAALFLFTDDSAEQLLAAIRSSEFGRKAPEEGFLLASQWDSVMRNLSDSFEVRLIDDLLADRRGKDGFFFAAIAAQQLGNFDFIFDPRARQQITLGQLATRDDRRFYDLWAHFTSRSFRGGQRPPPGAEMKIESYQIDARLDANLHLDVTTRMKVVPATASRSMTFELSPRMKVTAAEINGVSAEVFRKESIRANLLRGDLNEAFLVVAPAAVEPGKPCEITIHHDGDVIVDAGNKVYFVASRSSWYPQRGIQFARYDMTFRHPRNLTLVASGDLMEDRVEGEERISRRQSQVPLRFVGFNLGDYVKTSLSRGGYRVDVYANRKLESALESRPVVVTPPPVLYPRRRPFETAQIPVLTRSPEARLEKMASDIADELEWMTQRFGPPPLKTLAVSPIPGQFGQGFPGLLYLSTLSYLDTDLRPTSSRELQAFFGELLHAHETAHQWWGNSVTSPGYEDDWLQEAIANYVALAIIEKRRGGRVLDEMLSGYRERLLRRDSSGQTAESAGPVTFGLRLQSSQAPGAWRTIIYDKGAWIIHMLRRRLGDELFWPMLADMARRFQGQSLSTTQFRTVAADFLLKQPAKDSYRAVDPKFATFFDTWTQSTGVPALKLQWSVKGAAPKVSLTATVTQSEVPDDFSDAVPVEIQLARGRSVTRWIRTADEPVTITVALPSPPTRVTLDPQNATLKR